MSTVSAIPTASDPAYASELAELPGFDRQVKKTLDQSDFLKLLSTQLANQDPLEPQKDTDMIAQMSTFSSVEQMGDMVTSLKAFIVAQDFSSAQSMLGKYVTTTSDKTSTTPEGATITESTRTTGRVTSVGYNADGVSVVRIGDREFSPADVTSVGDTADSAAAGTATRPEVDSASSLMGRAVTVTETSTATSSLGDPILVTLNTSGVVTGFGSNAEGHPVITVGGRTFTLDQVVAVGKSG